MLRFSRAAAQMAPRWLSSGRGSSALTDSPPWPAVSLRVFGLASHGVGGQVGGLLSVGPPKSQRDSVWSERVEPVVSRKGAEVGWLSLHRVIRLRGEEFRRPGQDQSKGSPSAGAQGCNVSSRSGGRSSSSRPLLCLDDDLPPYSAHASCSAAADGPGNLDGSLSAGNGDHLAWNVLWLATPPHSKEQRAD